MILGFTWVTFVPLSSVLLVWVQNAYYAQDFSLIVLITHPAGDYCILRESRKFQPVCLHLGLQVLYPFQSDYIVFLLQPSLWSDNTLNLALTYQPTG